jgi:hypothetical protein
LLLMVLGLASLVAAALLGATPAAPTGESCDERGTRVHVARFITAFNRGDFKTLDRLFARGTGWRWYSVGTAPGRRTQGVAYDRKTLIKYFRARHKKHERLELQYLQFNGLSAGYGHFEFQVLRKADDISGKMPRTYFGKGAMSCWAGKLGVWAMGEAA